MKKKFCYSIFIAVMFASFSLVAFGSYIIKDFEFFSVNEGELGQIDDSYAKVTFAENTSYNVPQKIMYVKKGDTISLIDAPKYSINGGYLQWNSGNNVLSINYGFDKKITVNSDLVFTSNSILLNEDTDLESLLNFDTSKGYKGGCEVSGRDINLSEGNGSVKNSMVNYGEFNSSVNVLKNATINMYVYLSRPGDSDNANTISSDFFPYDGHFDISSFSYKYNGSDAVNSDTTLSLEDPTDVKSDYKPTAGGTSNKNYCVSRLKLTNDLLLLNSNINIGARDGCYGGDPNYYQINYQNFIVGQYCEIDLCGNYLIVGDSSKIWLVGSITNSNPSSGGIIFESGGSIEAGFTVEDHHHEKSLPTTYSSGDAAFSMYRCAYFNANSIFLPGSKMQLGMVLFFGKSQGYAYKAIDFIGGSESIIDLSKTVNGRISRNISYDNLMLGNFSNSADVKNLMSQRISYRISNCDFDLNLPDISVKLEGGGAFSGNLNIIFGKDNFYISPYYSFYLENTSCNVKSNLVFMPGSSLTIDENSTITLSADGVKTTQLYTAVNEAYQRVGGLTFMKEKYDYAEAVKWICDGDDIGADKTTSGNTARIFKDNSKFWSYVNKSIEAHCDLYGQIDFDSDITLYKKYTLAGNINVYNFSNFLSSVNESNGNINFYSKNFKSASSKYKNLIPNHNNMRLNISDFYTIPLISFGYVLTNPISPTTIVDASKTHTYKYDKEKGVIYSVDESEFYCYVFNNNSVEHLNKSRYDNESDFKSGTDDCDGKFIKVVYDTNRHCLVSQDASYSGDFVFFHGAMVKANNISSDGTTCTIDLTKFRYSDGEYNGAMNNRSATYTSSSYNGYSCWRLS